MGRQVGWLRRRGLWETRIQPVHRRRSGTMVQYECYASPAHGHTVRCSLHRHQLLAEHIAAATFDESEPRVHFIRAINRDV